MEVKNYTELQNDVNIIYNRHTEKDLRSRVYKNINGEIEVSNPYVYITKYNTGTKYEHTIEISIPGKKTFIDRKGNLIDTKNSNDIKITVVQLDGTSVVLTHEQIIKDLYVKINGNYDNYIWYKTFLTIVYSNINLNEIEGLNNIYTVLSNRKRSKKNKLEQSELLEKV